MSTKLQRESVQWQTPESAQQKRKDAGSGFKRPQLSEMPPVELCVGLAGPRPGSRTQPTVPLATCCPSGNLLPFWQPAALCSLALPGAGLGREQSRETSPVFHPQTLMFDWSPASRGCILHDSRMDRQLQAFFSPKVRILPT